MKIQFAQKYVEKYNLPTERLSDEERKEAWKEVASNDEARIAHAEALGKQISNEIAAIVEAAKDNNVAALEELATAVLTREIVLDVLKENIASMVMEVRQLAAWENPFYTIKRLNKVTMINNVPTIGAIPTVQVGKQYQTLPIMTADNQASYTYSTRNALIGRVNERDEAAAEIRRAILENREVAFIELIRAATELVDPNAPVLANSIALPNYAMANGNAPDTNNVVVDTLANGLTKRNLSELMFKLEQYGYTPKVLFCSARRKADIRSWITTTSTSASPVDFFTQREILTTGKLEGLYGLEIRVLNYLKDDECYMWDNSRDFGEIFLRGDVQVEDRISTEGAFMRELIAAQNEGIVLYNARRIAKLQLV